jgi:hypothetical protein
MIIARRSGLSKKFQENNAKEVAGTGGKRRIRRAIDRSPIEQEL